MKDISSTFWSISQHILVTRQSYSIKKDVQIVNLNSTEAHCIHTQEKIIVPLSRNCKKFSRNFKILILFWGCHCIIQTLFYLENMLVEAYFECYLFGVWATILKIRIACLGVPISHVSVLYFYFKRSVCE